MKWVCLAQVSDATKLLDHAAAQDMRWWFLGLLGVMMAGIYFLARYWGTRHDRLSERLDRVQDERTKYLEGQNAQMMQVLGENTIALRKFSEAVQGVQHLFEPAPQRGGAARPGDRP